MESNKDYIYTRHGVIPALGKQRQEDFQLERSPGNK
jgi:hypothetical protein